MSFNGYKMKREQRPQQASLFGPDSIADDRALTPEDFATLNEEFRFTVDAAASSENAKLPKFFSIENSGLFNSWAGERVYCNPPYSEIYPWIDKAWREVDAPLVVLLIPANRTEQIWWQKGVEPFRDRGDVLTTRFLPGRIRFLKRGALKIDPNERPPFGCVLCIWTRPKQPNAQR